MLSDLLTERIPEVKQESGFISQPINAKQFFSQVIGEHLEILKNIKDWCLLRNIFLQLNS